MASKSCRIAQKRSRLGIVSVWRHFDQPRPVGGLVNVKVIAGFLQDVAGSNALRLQSLYGLLHRRVCTQVAYAPQRPLLDQGIGLVDLRLQ